MELTNMMPSRKMEAIVTSTILGWGMGAFLLGYSHTFENASSRIFGACIISIQFILILLYFRNNLVNQFFNNVNLSTIALLHSWRIFAGWVFISYQDRLPHLFIQNAAYGDILAGFLGLSVFIFGRTKLAFYIFNLVGLFDFILAVGTGITLSLVYPESMHLLRQLPLIIIPLFGVPISGLTHVVSLSRLIKMRNIQLNRQID